MTAKQQRDMTPQEVSDHKRHWAPGHAVDIHSDYDWRAKDWCRKHIGRHQWSMDTFTDVYQHTVRFEHDHHAKAFAEQFGDAVIENRNALQNS